MFQININFYDLTQGYYLNLQLKLNFSGSHPPSPSDSGVSDVEQTGSFASDEESKSINGLPLLKSK